MAQAKKIDVDQLQKALEEPMQRMIEEVARSISEAPDSDIIGGSEFQVRDAMGRLRTEVFERGIQLRIDQAEADFFPGKEPENAASQTREEQRQASDAGAHGQR